MSSMYSSPYIYIYIFVFQKIPRLSSSQLCKKLKLSSDVPTSWKCHCLKCSPAQCPHQDKCTGTLTHVWDTNWHVVCPTWLPVHFHQHKDAHTHWHTRCWLQHVCLCPTHAIFINSGGPKTTARTAVPMHHAQTCLAIGEKPQICQKEEEKAPHMTIKPGQYFMKMKCSGTVYSGRGGRGRGSQTNGCKALIMWSFSVSEMRFTRRSQEAVAHQGPRIRTQRVKANKCSHFPVQTPTLLKTVQKRHLMIQKRSWFYKHLITHYKRSWLF